MNLVLPTIVSTILSASIIDADDKLQTKLNTIKNVLRGGSSESKEAAVLTLIGNGEENAVEVKSGGVTCDIGRSAKYAMCVGDLTFQGSYSLSSSECISWCQDQGLGCCEFQQGENDITRCYHGTNATVSPSGNNCDGLYCDGWAWLCSPPPVVVSSQPSPSPTSTEKPSSQPSGRLSISSSPVVVPPGVCGDFDQADFNNVCSGGCGDSEMCPSPNDQHKCSGTCGVHMWKGGGDNNATICKEWCMQQGPGCCEHREGGACTWKSEPLTQHSSAHSDAKAVVCTPSSNNNTNALPLHDASPSDTTVSVPYGSME